MLVKGPLFSLGEITVPKPGSIIGDGSNPGLHFGFSTGAGTKNAVEGEESGRLSLFIKSCLATLSDGCSRHDPGTRSGSVVNNRLFCCGPEDVVLDSDIQEILKLKSDHPKKRAIKEKP